MSINQQTAIVLLDKKSSDNDYMKTWLEESSFTSNEIADIFEALEDLSDFTMPSRPNVILIEVDSPKKEFSAIRNMMQIFSDADSFPIMALSETGKIVNDKECFEGNFVELKAQIEKLIPQNVTGAKNFKAVSGQKN